jgi:hypothetical protein
VEVHQLRLGKESALRGSERQEERIVYGHDVIDDESDANGHHGDLIGNDPNERRDSFIGQSPMREVTSAGE